MVGDEYPQSNMTRNCIFLENFSRNNEKLLESGELRAHLALDEIGAIAKLLTLEKPKV